MKYLKRFNESESENSHDKLPDNFTGNDMNLIHENIPFVRKPGSWEEILEYASVDLDDLSDDVLESLFKLPVYTVKNISELFERGDSKGLLTDHEEKNIYDEIYIKNNITQNNYIFYEELKTPYQMFIVRLMVNDVDCGLLVDTQEFSYMRYVSIIKEFGDMYDYYKKDLELRKS